MHSFSDKDARYGAFISSTVFKLLNFKKGLSFLGHPVCILRYQKRSLRCNIGMLWQCGGREPAESEIGGGEGR